MPIGNSINNWSTAALLELSQAQESIWLWVNGGLHIQLFQQLLTKLRQGVAVELAIPKQQITRLDITTQYWQRFKAAGGVLHAYSERSDWQFYVIIDDQQLLLETGGNNQHGRVDTLEAPDTLRKCRKHFIQIKNAAHNFTDSFAPESSGIDPPQVRLWLSTDFVEIDEVFELHWEIRGAQEQRINQGVGAVPRSGRKLLSARLDTSFTLTAINEWGTTEEVVQIQVNPKPKVRYRFCTFDHRTKDEITLSAIPDFPHRYAVVKGQLVRLYWEVLNADKCRIDETGHSALQGFVDLLPEKSSVYTITAEGKKGVVRQAIVLNVFSADGLEHLWMPQAEAPSLLQKGEKREALEENLLPPKPEWWPQETAAAEELAKTTNSVEQSAWNNITAFFKRYLTNG